MTHTVLWFIGGVLAFIGLLCLITLLELITDPGEFPK